ncbi:MAG: ATP-binding cassette domain-containing protein, partial [Pseudomonadota bacterium]|nr:ATP-binding cassette domain-containing protein [Pseudomonadota bacterium]
TEIRPRVGDLLSLLGIGELAARYPAQLSGGQRQRVALARALAIEPGLLLLDEPFGALDAQVRKNLRIWLRELHARLNLTSVFVTHDQSEALEMADRVAVLRMGRIEQVDTPERLYTQPATPFVHQFLGESVRLACTVQAGHAMIPSLPGAPIPTDCPPGPAFALIRPHEIGLQAGAGPAQVIEVHVTGPLMRVHLRLADQGVDALQPLTAWKPNPGDSCVLDLSRARIYPVKDHD